jgi:hypothetical protein
MKNLIAAALMSMAIPVLAAPGVKLIPTHIDAKEILVREHMETGVVEYQAVDGGWVEAKDAKIEKASADTTQKSLLQKVDYSGRPQRPADPGYENGPGYDNQFPGQGGGGGQWGAGAWGGGGVWGGGVQVNPCVGCGNNCGGCQQWVTPPCIEPCNDIPPCVSPCNMVPTPLPAPIFQPNFYSNGYVVRQRRLVRPIQQYPQGGYNYRRYNFR